MSTNDTLARLERVTERLENLESRLKSSTDMKSEVSPSQSSESQPAGSGSSAFVSDFDKLKTQFLTPLHEKAKSSGSDVEKAMNLFEAAVDAQRAMLVLVSKCKKPSDPDTFQKLLKPTSDAMAKVEECRDRKSKCFNHLSMIAEGVACLQWVCVDKTPASTLGDYIPGSEMYGNKVVMEFKGKHEDHVALAQGFKTFLVELQKYVRTHHTTGLSWNANGSTDYSAGAAVAPPAPVVAKAGPPPPPPPPPPGFFDEKSKVAPAKGNAAAMFAELNALGEAGATANLKKVQKEQMTHKNPGLRASSVVPDKASASTSPAKVGPPAAAVAKKPPRMEQQGAKWFIENMEGNRDLVVSDCSVKTAVCLVQCRNSLLQVPGKINTLQIDGCFKTSVVVESCVGSVDIINCKSCEVQITGSTPMVTMDGCSGIMVYLSAQCLADDVAIISSKCSEMNLVLPAKSEEEDPVELAVPEQFETKVRGGKLVTTALSHVGA